MKTLLLLILSQCAFAQCTFMAQPIPLKTTQRIFDNGRELGLWHVVLSNRTGGQCHTTRAQIESLMPGVTFLPNDVALDILTRRASTSGWATFSAYGKLALQLAPASLAMYGAITGVNGWTIGGAGLGTFQFVLTRSDARIANPGKYSAQFMPDQVSLDPGLGAEFYLAAGLTHGAEPIGPLDVNSQPIPFIAPQPAVKPANTPTGQIQEYEKAPGVLAMVNW